MNRQLASANDSWNKAVDSRKPADLSKAASTMTTLSGTITTQAGAAHNGTFSAKARKLAQEVGQLGHAKTPTKTVDTASYNTAVQDITSYCTGRFPATR